jgi:hypothetical protein
MCFSGRIGAYSHVEKCKKVDSLLGIVHVHNLLLILSRSSTRMFIVLGAFLK